MKLIKFGMIVLAAAFFTGCASIVSDSSYPVSVNSNVEDAEVTVKDQDGQVVHKGAVPTNLTLSASDGFFQPASYSFQFDDEDYMPTTTTADAQLDGWYIGNILFGGLVGWLIVDPASGAMWKLEENVTANLSPDEDDDEKASDKESEESEKAKDTAAEEESAEETREEADKAGSSQEQDAEISESRKRLEELKEMHESGLITDKEYERKRQETVENM